MKFRKKKNDVFSSSDSIVLQFPVGAPVIAGGDAAYAVFNALSLALVSLETFKKITPKKAKQLAPVAEVWQRLYSELRPYADCVEMINSELH